MGRPPRRESAARERIDRRLSALRRPMVDFATAFCAIPTVNPPGERYLECCEFLAEKLARLGLDARIVRVPPAEQAAEKAGSEAYPRASVLARWDVGARRTFHLTGHYDVVPPTPGWRRDPFKPVVQGRRLIARGADDMKTSNTAAIFAVQAMLEAGVAPPWNVELSFTPDAETGGALGLGFLVRSGALRADAAVVCEGGSGRTIGCAHKGVLWLDVAVLGKAGHACDPASGVNALEAACRLIDDLGDLRKAYAARRTAYRTNRERLRRPTLMVGGIAGGGGKVNTIPGRFHFTIDRRMNPEERLADVRAEILAAIRRFRRRHRRVRVEVEPLLHVPPGWTDPQADVCRAARSAYRTLTGRSPRFRMTPGFTDMHFLTQDVGIPAIMYGTTGAGAHADMEYTHIPSMVQTARFYTALVLHMPAD